MNETTAGKPDRTLIFVIATVAALVVIALIVVFTRGQGEPLDESTPAGVVQRYTQAVIAGDDETARGYLSSHIVAECTTAVPGPFDGMRVTLASTTEHGESADVGVVVSYSGGGGLFGQSGYQYDETFRLVRDDGAWRITATPWEFAVCSETSL